MPCEYTFESHPLRFHNWLSIGAVQVLLFSRYVIFSSFFRCSLVLELPFRHELMCEVLDSVSVASLFTSKMMCTCMEK